MDELFSTKPARTRGMILGKFLPPHMGHVLLVDFARHYCDELTVLVCTMDAEPICGLLRAGWMRALFDERSVRIVHVHKDLPQYPEEHPDFWRIWRDLVLDAMPDGTDLVFASEDYGHKLAEVLDARYVPVDEARGLVPVSGTAIRDDPMANWEFLPDVVRPYFVRRVCVFGPESTGKTTLCARLAEHFQTVAVHEYARLLLEAKEGDCEYEDITRIARGQAAAEDAMARRANKLLFCDTDLLTTMIWSDTLFGRCPDWIREEARRRRYDLYLVLDVDVPWVDDKVRYLPHERREFMAQCIEVLEREGRPYVVIRGEWEERFAAACRAVEGLAEHAERP